MIVLCGEDSCPERVEEGGILYVNSVWASWVPAKCLRKLARSYLSSLDGFIKEYQYEGRTGTRRGVEFNCVHWERK